MENVENNLYLIPILTIFLSGLFGLLVAIVTWKLASKREKQKFKQELALREFKEKEELYVSFLLTLDKTIRFTKRSKDYTELFNDIAHINAKSQLFATEEINKKMNKISDFLYAWSTEYKHSLPKEIGGTNFGIVSNIDNEYRDKADKIYPDLIKSINELVEIIKKELNFLKNKI